VLCIGVILFVNRENRLIIIKAFHILTGSEYVIKGKLTNNTDNAKMMYMGYLDSDDIYADLKIDSAIIVDNKFQFKGKTQYPARAYLSTDLYHVDDVTPEKTAILYLEPRSTVSCVINLENPRDSIKVYNSPTDNDYRYMLTRMKPIDERRTNLFMQRDSIYQTGDTVQIAKLNNEIHIVNNEYLNGWLNTALSLDKNSALAFDSYVSILLGYDTLTAEQLRAIETRFEEVPWYIKQSNSGKRVAKAIEYKKK